MKLIIQDTSKYNLVDSTVNITYVAQIESTEPANDIKKLFMIFKAFSFASSTIVKENGTLIISGPYSSGDFTQTIRDFRQTLFRALASIANDISVDLEFKALPTKEDIAKSKERF